VKKKKSRLDRFFLWNWRNFVILAILFILTFFYRNRIIKDIFEPIKLYNFVFYGVLIGVPIYFLISFIYSFFNKKKVQKKNKIENKIDKFLLLNWKKAGIGLIIFVVAVVLHNLIYAFALNFFGIEFEEAFFFLLAVIGVPIYFLISFIYTLIKKIGGKK
jgi:hypothetical protein